LYEFARTVAPLMEEKGSKLEEILDWVLQMCGTTK
jgi:hypothetical protein